MPGRASRLKAHARALFQTSTVRPIWAYCKSGRCASVAIGRSAAAVVHDDSPHAIRILVEGEPDPPEFLEEGALARAAITRDGANDGPASLESIRRHI